MEGSEYRVLGEGVGCRVKGVGCRVSGVGDLSPERANAILEYLYHHNKCPTGGGFL